MGFPEILHSTVRVFLANAVEIIPLFLLAILIGAWIEEYVSEATITRFLTGRHPATMLLASFTGAILPLCTCGMVPLAVSLRRRGSDVKHTFSFLTAGAAFSVPVLLLTWTVLGGWWALVRFGVSVVFGLAVGYASVWALRREAARSAEAMAAIRHGDHTHGPGSATALRPGPEPDADFEFTEIRGQSRFASVLRRIWSHIREYGPWVLISLLAAALVDVLVPRHWVGVLYGERTALGSLLAALSGIPFYFCSGAELPLVRELLLKGMGAGPATSMLLAVPIVNLLTFGVVSRWIGARGALIYLALCVVSSALIGEATGLVWPMAASP